MQIAVEPEVEAGLWCVACPHFLAYIQGLRVDENVQSRP